MLARLVRPRGALQIAKNGSEPLLTWRPSDADGLPEGADQVVLNCGRLEVAGDIKVSFYVKEPKNKLLQ